MMKPHHAFVDESIRRNRYHICVAPIAVHNLPPTRRALNELRVKGQRRIHFADESDRQRRLILSGLAKLEVSTTIYVVTGGSEVGSRTAILEAMIPRLQEDHVTRLILDSRDSQDKHDRSTIYRVLKEETENEIEYAHQKSHSEPLLWIPDAIAWAWGRGGDWKRRVEEAKLVNEVIRLQGH